LRRQIPNRIYLLLGFGKTMSEVLVVVLLEPLQPLNLISMRLMLMLRLRLRLMLMLMLRLRLLLMLMCKGVWLEALPRQRLNGACWCARMGMMNGRTAE
jgi:hypothetical protein